jgi:F-type H+-transporting ATPase subunit b
MLNNKCLNIITILSNVVFLTYPSIAAEGTGMPQMVIPDFMPQLIWLLLIFTMLYLSMKYIALPRITEIISNRDLKIVNDLEKAEEIKNQIVKTSKEHQDAIESTNNKIKILVNEINQKSIQEAEIKLQECQNNINKKIEEEKLKLVKEVDQFSKNIEKISNESVESIIEKIYYVKPNKNNLKKIVSKYSESYNND